MTALNDAGVFGLKAHVNAMDERLSKCIENQKAVESCPNPAPSSHPTLQHTVPPNVAPETAATDGLTATNSAESVPWAADGVPSISANPPVVPGCSNDTGNNSWVTVAARNRPARPVMPVPVKGSRSDVSLKTVPRKKAVLSAYVGRLDPTTIAEELTKYLTSEGIKGVVCKKLIAKDGRKYNYAAFYVTCCAESRDKFYDETCWPQGVELRDWVYYSK